MKNISTELKNALKKDSVTERDYIILDGTKNRIYLWFNLYDDCYKDGNIIQNFIMKRLEFTYEDTDINFYKREFKAYKEFKLEDGDWETISYGRFIVTDIKKSDTKENVKITAYDYALKFANIYTTELDYPSGTVTLSDVLNECCLACEVETDLTSFTNSGFIVDSNQFGNTAQYGNVISAIAGISGNFAKIIDDKLTLRFTSETDEIIEINEYNEFEDKRDTRPVTIIGLGVSNIEGENVVQNWEEGIAEYGENRIMIYDNPFAYTQGKRQLLLPALYEKLKGFSYSSMVLKNCLSPYFECGDKVKVRNKDGELIETIILRTNFKGVICDFEAPSIIKASVEYENTIDTLSIAKRTEIIVDKMENEIKLLAEQIDTISETVAGSTLILENSANSLLHKLTVKGNLHSLYCSDDLNGSAGLYPTVGKFPFIGLFPSRKRFKMEALYCSEDLYPVDIYLIQTTSNGTHKYLLPFSDLNYLDENIHDEFIIEDGKATLIQRVGVNYLGQKYPLENYKIKTFDDIPIVLEEGLNVLKMESFPMAILEATYLKNNEYTKYFSTKAETKSAINLSKDELEAYVEIKTDGEHIKNSLNIDKSGVRIEGKQIDLKGTVTANEYFKILDDGSMEAVNGSFSGDIFLGDGGKVVGGDGLKTNLFYSSVGKYKGFDWLGFDYSTNWNYDMEWHKTDTTIDINIPANFKIVSAILTLEHTAIRWFGYDNHIGQDFDVWGYSRNLKLYRSESSNYDFEMSYGGEYDYSTGGGYLQEIPNAFGSDTYTPSNTSGSSSVLKDTIDIGSSLNVGKQKLVIRTTNGNPATNNSKSAGEQTGMARAYINIIGYMNYTEE